MYCSLDFLVGKLTCRIISIQVNSRTEEGKRYYDHNHFCTELHWIESGSCDFICDKTRYPISAGQLMIIPPRMYHREANISKNCKKVSILVDISTGKEKLNALEDCFCSAFLPDAVKILPADSPELVEMCNRICWLKARAETDSISMERLRIVCNSFFVELLDNISEESLINDENNVKGELFEDLVLENFIAHQFMPGASFSALAEQLHVSTRQLYRIITQKYGINYRDKMKEIRIEIATNFLCNTDKSIAQIAEIMGYSDTSSFSNFMKKATGSSPLQIRKMGR